MAVRLPDDATIRRFDDSTRSDRFLAALPDIGGQENRHSNGERLGVQPD